MQQALKNIWGVYILLSVITMSGLLLSCSSSSDPDQSAANNKLIIDFSQSEVRTQASLVSVGFINSTAAFPPDLIATFGPGFWRVGSLEQARDVEVYKAKVTLNLGDSFRDFKGGWENAKPWMNWTEFENFYQKTVQTAMSQSIQVAYWEIWNEPDGGQFWQGTPEQFLEMSARAIRTIRSVKPDAKIIGPSLSYFSLHEKETYLDYLEAQGVHVDALSWHEFVDDPKQIITHVSQMKQALALKGRNVEIHINESVSGPHHLIPGWNLAYLVSLFESKVDVANRSCWERVSGPGATSECLSGLNGLLTSDNSKVTPLGFTYSLFARLAGPNYVVNNSLDKLSAIASIDGTAKGSILIGAYSCGKNNLWCRFVDHQASDEPLADQRLTVSVRSPLFSGKRLRFISLVVSNENLEQGFAAPPKQTTEFTASSTGQVQFEVTIPDGTVINYDFSIVE